jgi:hypothetical protein
MNATEEVEQQGEQPVKAKELAPMFRMAVSTVYRSKLPHIRVGGRGGGVRFYPSEVRKELSRRARARVGG